MNYLIRTLPCNLTFNEVHEKGKVLANTEIELQSAKDDFKDLQANHKEFVKAQETMIQNISIQIETEKEEREVKCELVYNSPRLGMKQIIRTDTEEVIEESDMTDRDKAKFHASLQTKMAM